MPQVDGGSYEVLPSGKYRARVRRTKHRAPTRKKEWRETLGSLDAVRKWVREVNDDLDKGLDPERPRVEEAQTLTVGAWWDRWWPVRCAAGISPRYREEMERRWRLHVEPTWGEVTLAEVTSDDVQRWVNELASRPGIGAVYLADIYKTLATLMSAAVDRRPRLIEFTPCYKVRLPQVVAKPRITTDEDGVLAIARRCADFEIFVVTMAYTGLRPEECAGLLRADAHVEHPYLAASGPRVDVLHNLIRLPYPDGALVEFPDGRLQQGPLKNRQSERIVRIPKFLSDLLGKQLASHDEPYVFVGPKGGLVRRATFNDRLWRPACDGRPRRAKRQGVAERNEWAPIRKGLELRGLRHTHKKILITENIPDFAIEARLGHSRKGISGVYAHVAEEVEDRIVKVLQRRWEWSLAREAEAAKIARRGPHVDPRPLPGTTTAYR